MPDALPSLNVVSETGFISEDRDDARLHRPNAIDHRVQFAARPSTDFFLTCHPIAVLCPRGSDGLPVESAYQSTKNCPFLSQKPVRRLAWEQY